MTRVLHVLDHSLPLHSGYTFRTRAIMKAQEAAGVEVRGITGMRHGEVGDTPNPEISPEIIDGLRFYRTNAARGSLPFISELREITKLSLTIQATANEWMPDIIHAHSPALCGAAGWRAAQALGIPFVYEIRAFWEDAAVGNRTGREGSFKYRMTRALETKVAERADALFTICEGLRADLIERGIEPGRIGVMPNGVDMSLFGDPMPRDSKLGEELGIVPDAPVIGYIGSFYDYEGIDDLIAAMPILRASHPGARLLIVGAGEMDKEWRAAASALPEPEAVLFTGRVAHEEVDRYYSLIDILAYPRKASRLTDLVTPLKPLEAMAQRRLVAASSVGGHRELISHGETGVLFPPDDPVSCAKALAEMLSDREGWEVMRERASQHVRLQHDWATNAQRYLSVYHLLLAGVNRGDGPAPSPPQQGLQV